MIVVRSETNQPINATHFLFFHRTSLQKRKLVAEVERKQEAEGRKR